jgi:hypothetical protein
MDDEQVDNPFFYKSFYELINEKKPRDHRFELH